ncbi:hypothetical protein [Amycolatopsis panacis]|nr:hypothetical protein [Amycolatopsis panacis]
MAHKMGDGEFDVAEPDAVTVPDRAVGADRDVRRVCAPVFPATSARACQ